MPKITLITVGKSKNKAFEALEADYTARLGHYTGFEIILINDSRKNDPLLRRNEESESILKKVPSGALLIGLDVLGKTISTEQLANQIQTWDNQSIKNICFVIGGPFGFSPEFKKQCRLLYSLSQLTLPHEMARVVLIEQLYRAHTILRGEKYHH